MPLTFRDTAIRGPQTFAIIVGISKYKYVHSLTYADKDAELFRDFLRSSGGGHVKEENIFCLLNDKALNSTFWTKGFQWLKAKKLQRGDRLFIYLAGHGDAIDEDQYFFLGYDCNPAGDKNNYLVGGAIQLYNLKKKIASETSMGVEVFLVMDACRSNELPGGTDGQNFLNTAVSQKKAGEIMMLATAAGQESLEDASIGSGHGLFTWYLVDGLSGMADTDGQPDFKVTFSEIRSYVDKNVLSVAQQRFKTKQDPYFCCDENSDKVVSKVDPAYLQQWMQTRKRLNRGGINSFPGFTDEPAGEIKADTSLVQMYNLFNTAVKDNNLTGSTSAEYYYRQMDKKSPDDPYTLDAKSTLEAEFINYAQTRVNNYLDCAEMGTRQKQENYEAGLRLEKAIALLRVDDPDFANSLRGRMYFLKAWGDFGPGGQNGDMSLGYQNGYACLNIDPGGAYINNKLALLHLENNRLDSAQYYAEKATRLAPKWVCPFATLTLVKKAMESKKTDQTHKQPKKPSLKNSVGVVVGGGVHQAHPTFNSNRNSNIDDVTGHDKMKFDVGIIYQAGIGKNISIRPAAQLSFDRGNEVFERRLVTGGPPFFDTIELRNTSITVSLPLIIRFSDKNTAAFISLGPSFSYILKQDDLARESLPLKKSVFSADGGLGVDIGLVKAGIILSPEIKYTIGISDMKEAANSIYADAVSSLKKQAITFSVYLRKR